MCTGAVIGAHTFVIVLIENACVESGVISSSASHNPTDSESALPW